MKRLIFILYWCAGGLLHAQDESLNILKRQLEESRTNYPAMRPQIFFSQDKYSPGDTAFFRLFILTEAERVLADRSLLTLEFIHPNGQTCATQVVSCQRFGAANQLILPDTLSAGLYEVRLFSDRMTHSYGLSTHLMVTGEKQLVKQPRAGEEVLVFPEGGHLVTGALNRVIIKAMGTLPVSAELHSDEGRIMPVVFHEPGLADLQFVAQKNRDYHIEYVIGDRKLRASLPATDPEAIALRVYRGPRKTFVVDLSTGPKGPRSATIILVGSRQLLYSKEVRFKSDRANILFSEDVFPEGYSEVFAIDEERKILAYRPMYISPGPAARMVISNLPESVSTRQDLKINVNISDVDGQPVMAGLAIAVVPDDIRLNALRTPDPSLELRPEPPYFDWTQPAEQIDREILTTPTPNGVVPVYPQLLYRANLSLTGKAYSRDASASLPYLSRMVIYLHNDLIQYETPIDGVGNFEFSKIYDFLGSDRVFYKVIHQGKLVPNITVDWNASKDEYISADTDHFSEGSQPDSYGVLRKRKRTIDKSFNYFLSGDTLVTPISNYNATLEKEFQGADISINPGEYVPFETMRELILEIVPAAKFRVYGKDSTVRMDLKSYSPFVAQRFAEDNALYVIDGYITTNTRFLMNLSPKDVISIKVIHDIGKLNRLENLARDGVLFVQTRIPERTRQAIERQLQPIAGLSPTLSAVTRYPVKPRIPDLRSLLYWTPLIEADSTGTATFGFRTSDLPGTYWVRVMGTTSTGHIVSAEKRFVVNFR